MTRSILILQPSGGVRTPSRVRPVQPTTPVPPRPERRSDPDTVPESRMSLFVWQMYHSRRGGWPLPACGESMRIKPHQ
jgi:hypothetical protein